MQNKGYCLILKIFFNICSNFVKENVRISGMFLRRKINFFLNASHFIRFCCHKTKHFKAKKRFT